MLIVPLVEMVVTSGFPPDTSKNVETHTAHAQLGTIGPIYMNKS